MLKKFQDLLVWPFSELVFFDVLVWNPFKVTAFNIVSYRILITSYKLLIIIVISHETIKELTI